MVLSISKTPLHMPTHSDNKLREKVIQALKTVYDPELPIDIYELGLIYEINPDFVQKKVHIIMTLTTPNCPAAEQIPAQIKEALCNLPEVENVQIDLTFDPPYSPERLSEVARLALDF